jgi:hypothetical protein
MMKNTYDWIVEKVMDIALGGDDMTTTTTFLLRLMATGTAYSIFKQY